MNANKPPWMPGISSCMAIVGALAMLLALVAAASTGESRTAIPTSATAPIGGTKSLAVPFWALIRERETPRISVGTKDTQGRPVTVGCAACHSTRPPNAENRREGDLGEFHQGLKMRHGSLACVACHHPDYGYESLRLADGMAIPFRDSMKLCAQCHGPQHRDYLNGSHGGMSGFWDLSKGPRVRNHCLDCHDAHAPALAPVQPAPMPRDRFWKKASEHGHER